MEDLPNVLLAAVPAFALLMAVELAWCWKAGRQLYETRDAFANMALGLGYLAIGILMTGFLLLFMGWLYSHRLWTVPASAWWGWALCFVAEDFSYYWFHRLSHEVRWFWASHSVHHSSEKYNLSVALRQTWTGPPTGTFIFWAWLPLAGFHPKMVLFMQSVNLLYQFWIHTQAIDRMPRWYEAILNTPSHHRVHHGSDFDYLDRNYAGTLMLWDRLFGTFAPERQTPTFGLTSNIESRNPLRIAFHEWRAILRDLRKARGVGDVVNYLLRAPGWSHDGSSISTPERRRRMSDNASEQAETKK